MKKTFKNISGQFSTDYKRPAILILLILLQFTIAITAYTNPESRIASINIMFLPVMIAGLIFEQWIGVFFWRDRRNFIRAFLCHRRAIHDTLALC